MRRGVFVLLALISTHATALLVTPEALERKLAEADLVADILITDWSISPDSLHHAEWQTQAVIEAVLRGDRLKDEAITLKGPGGEIDGTGIYLNGLPRPRNGKRYRAHLINRGAHYEVTGWTAGLVPLDHKRNFTQNRTDGSNGEGNGPILRWDDTYLPIPYYVSSLSFALLPNFVTAIDTSFSSWGAVSGSKMSFIGMGCTSSTKNKNDGINNVVLVTDAWRFDSAIIAITRNFYVADSSALSGQILDSDILLNGVNHDFTTNGEASRHDIQNILTHEIGHLLGLGHEIDPVESEATMYAVAQTEETLKRSLHANDTAGILETYRGNKISLGGPTLSCNVGDSSLGCASAHRRTGSAGGFILSLGYLLFLVFLPKGALFFKTYIDRRRRSA